MRFGPRKNILWPSNIRFSLSSVQLAICALILCQTCLVCTLRTFQWTNDWAFNDFCVFVKSVWTLCILCILYIVYIVYCVYCVYCIVYIVHVIKVVFIILLFGIFVFRSSSFVVIVKQHIRERWVDAHTNCVWSVMFSMLWWWAVVMLSWHWLSWLTNYLSTKIEENHTFMSSDGQRCGKCQMKKTSKQAKNNYKNLNSPRNKKKYLCLSQKWDFFYCFKWYFVSSNVKLNCASLLMQKNVNLNN
jgi:hypothetical protein